MEPSYYSPQVSRSERFYFGEKSKEDVFLESGGREECVEQYSVERKTFPAFVLEYVARGSAQIRLGRERWQLTPGSVFVYGSIPHEISCTSRGGLTKYFFCLRGSGASRFLSIRGLSVGQVLRMDSPAVLREIFDDLIRMGSSKRPYRKESCLAIFDYALMKIEDLAESSVHLAGGAYLAYQQCREYIASHAKDLLTMEEVAQACHFDAAYICRLFQRFGTGTPYQYLMECRMGEAASLLRHSTILVQELSERLGYDDPSVFSRAFKRVHGVAPSHYR